MSTHDQATVNLPALTRDGRNPRRSTISDLLPLMADDDHAIEKACRDTEEPGLIDAEKINAKDGEVAEAEFARSEALLPELLATNLNVLRHFADAPKAEVIA